MKFTCQQLRPITDAIFPFKGDTPIFCTAKEELSFVRADVLDERETEMVRVRWRVFAFSSQISEAEQLQVPPCPRCFAELVYPSPNSVPIQ